MARFRNGIIQRLPDRELDLVRPHLEFVQLRRGIVLEGPRTAPAHAFFIEDGLASVVMPLRPDEEAEVGVIGSEGMTGLSIVMAADGPSGSRAFMQVRGSAWRISRKDLHQCIDRSPALHRPLLAYAHDFLIQVSRTALANALSMTEERLARWLLLADDRLVDTLPLTHEFLATMLGVHRPAVTVALLALERRGLVTRSRGKIRITDRSGLERQANGAYKPHSVQQPLRAGE